LQRLPAKKVEFAPDDKEQAGAYKGSRSNFVGESAVILAHPVRNLEPICHVADDNADTKPKYS